MCLVDDEHLVLREDRRALDGVDREQRVVGDDDLGELGVFPGHLGEAFRTVGALGGAQALPRRDRHLRPGPIGHSGRQVVAVTGLGLVCPVAQPQQVLAQLAGGRGGLELVEQSLLLVLRHALVQAVQAQIVRPALEHGELRAAAQQRVQGVDGARQVPLDELALEGEGGGGHDHSLPVGEGGHEIAEGLSGAGAGLDQQMRAVVDRVRDGLGHGHLAGALRTADGGDGGMQEFGEGGLRHSATTLRLGTDNRAIKAGTGGRVSLMRIRRGGNRIGPRGVPEVMTLWRAVTADHAGTGRGS